MNIQELSVGDWVRIYVANEERYCKVDEIRWNNILGKYVCEVCDRTFSLSEAYLHPIPLTPEILEKNGFVKNGEYDEWDIGTWETPYLLGVSLERPAITIKWNGSNIFIDQANNVHQLQHALRLVGIEKEIEL